MTYRIGAWANTKEQDIEELKKKERMMMRNMTGLYRKENGHYYSNKVIYEEAGIVQHGEQWRRPGV